MTWRERMRGVTFWHIDRWDKRCNCPGGKERVFTNGAGRYVGCPVCRRTWDIDSGEVVDDGRNSRMAHDDTERLEFLLKFLKIQKPGGCVTSYPLNAMLTQMVRTVDDDMMVVIDRAIDYAHDKAKRGREGAA